MQDHVGPKLWFAALNVILRSQAHKMSVMNEHPLDLQREERVSRSRRMMSRLESSSRKPQGASRTQAKVDVSKYKQPWRLAQDDAKSRF